MASTNRGVARMRTEPLDLETLGRFKFKMPSTRDLSENKGLYDKYAPKVGRFVDFCIAHNVDHKDLPTDILQAAIFVARKRKYEPSKKAVEDLEDYDPANITKKPYTDRINAILYLCAEYLLKIYGNEIVERPENPEFHRVALELRGRSLAEQYAIRACLYMHYQCLISASGEIRIIYFDNAHNRPNADPTRQRLDYYELHFDEIVELEEEGEPSSRIKSATKRLGAPASKFRFPLYEREDTNTYAFGRKDNIINLKDGNERFAEWNEKLESIKRNNENFEDFQKTSEYVMVKDLSRADDEVLETYPRLFIHYVYDNFPSWVYGQHLFYSTDYVFRFLWFMGFDANGTNFKLSKNEKDAREKHIKEIDSLGNQPLPIPFLSKLVSHIEWLALKNRISDAYNEILKWPHITQVCARAMLFAHFRAVINKEEMRLFIVQNTSGSMFGAYHADAQDEFLLWYTQILYNIRLLEWKVPESWKGKTGTEKARERQKELQRQKAAREAEIERLQRLVGAPLYSPEPVVRGDTQESLERIQEDLQQEGKTLQKLDDEDLAKNAEYVKAFIDGNIEFWDVRYTDPEKVGDSAQFWPQVAFDACNIRNYNEESRGIDFDTYDKIKKFKLGLERLRMHFLAYALEENWEGLYKDFIVMPKATQYAMRGVLFASDAFVIDGNGQLVTLQVPMDMSKYSGNGSFYDLRMRYYESHLDQIAVIEGTDPLPGRNVKPALGFYA